MKTGFIFTILVSWLIGGFAVLQFLFAKLYNEHIAHKEALYSFALFWLAIGSTFFLSGLNHLFIWIGDDIFALATVYAVQAALGITMVLASWHVMVRLRVSPAFLHSIVTIYLFLAVAFWAALFQFGFLPPDISYFSAQILPHPYVRLIYSIMFLPLFMGIMYDIFQRYDAGSSDGSYERFLKLSGLSLLVLGVAGTLDELSLLFDWAIAFARLITLSGSMMAFFAVYAFREKGEEWVV